MPDKSIWRATLVKIDHDSDAVFTTISNVTKINSVPMREFETVNMEALADTIEAFVSGLERTGEFAFELETDPTDANHTILNTLVGNKTARNHQIVFPFAVAITMQFEALPYSLTFPSGDAESPVLWEYKAKRTGAITYT